MRGRAPPPPRRDRLRGRVAACRSSSRRARPAAPRRAARRRARPAAPCASRSRTRPRQIVVLLDEHAGRREQRVALAAGVLGEVVAELGRRASPRSVSNCSRSLGRGTPCTRSGRRRARWTRSCGRPSPSRAYGRARRAGRGSETPARRRPRRGTRCGARCCGGRSSGRRALCPFATLTTRLDRGYASRAAAAGTPSASGSTAAPPASRGARRALRRGSRRPRRRRPRARGSRARPAVAAAAATTSAAIATPGRSARAPTRVPSTLRGLSSPARPTPTSGGLARQREAGAGDGRCDDRGVTAAATASESAAHEPRTCRNDDRDECEQRAAAPAAAPRGRAARSEAHGRRRASQASARSDQTSASPRAMFPSGRTGTASASASPATGLASAAKAASAPRMKGQPVGKNGSSKADPAGEDARERGVRQRARARRSST